MLFFKNLNLKKIFFYFFTLLLILIFYLLLDFLLSNTLLKNKMCYDYTSNEKGYYYFLKKNCHTKERFKKSFPTTNLFTDKFGLRTGKFTQKVTRNKNILIFGDSMTFGVGLEYENTYAGIIDKKMINYNVYNFGVGSYAPSVHLYKLKEAIKNNILPNKILLFLDLSDVRDEAKRWIDDGDGPPKSPEEKPHWAKNKHRKKIENNFKLSHELAALINFNLRNIRNKLRNTLLHNENKVKLKLSMQGNYTYTKVENLDKRY